MPILTLSHVSYVYEGEKTPVFEDLNYTFDAGRIYAVVGRSGAGKTTLLSLLSGLTRPTKGTILVEDKDIRSIDKYRYRSRYVGVVFQNFNLLPNLTARENVILSMDIAGMKGLHAADKKLRADELLDKVGLDDREAGRRVLKLSGGQQQRVAIARALSYDPEILLADEPTGNLDGETQEEIMEIFRMLADEGKCIVIVTHSPTVAAQADAVYELKKAATARRKPRQRPDNPPPGGSKPSKPLKRTPPPPYTGGSTLGLD